MQQQYDEVCKHIANMHPNILATGVAQNAKFIGSFFKELVWKPKPDRISVMLGQAMLMTGISETNEDFFGKTRVIAVQHDNLHVFMFPVDGRERTPTIKDGDGRPKLDAIDSCCIVVMVIMPPYDHEELVGRVLDYLTAANICATT